MSIRRNTPKAPVVFDGQTVIEIVPHPMPATDKDGKPLLDEHRKPIVDKNGKPQVGAIVPHVWGDDYSDRPYDLFWYEVPATGDILKRKLYTYDTKAIAKADSLGRIIERKAPQEQLRLEICRASGLNLDIDGALEWLENEKRNHSIKATIEKLPCLDEDGELRRDENGIPMYWYRMRLVNPDRVNKNPPEGAIDAPQPERAAEAEAKRAQKGKRGYAGNTGED